MTRIVLLALVASTLGSCGRSLTAPVVPAVDIDCYSRTTFGYTGHVERVADIPAGEFGILIDSDAR